MKVLLLNGSPRAKGCTYTALKEVSLALEESGVQTEILHVARGAVRGCIACGKCFATQRCIFGDDDVNPVLDKMEEAHGLIVGSPVYYASPNGTMLSFMDRMFYAGAKRMAYKPGASVVSARRAGTTASLDVMNKYFMICNMPLVPSQYWPMVHGSDPKDVQKDEEGLQIMRTLGRNMAWMLKCFAQGEAPPMPEEKGLRTDFIR